MVYGSSGEYLFSLESPSRETFHDAMGDLVAFIRNNQRITVDVTVRQLSDDRGAPGVIW
jgi:hypothetical protein